MRHLSMLVVGLCLVSAMSAGVAAQKAGQSPPPGLPVPDEVLRAQDLLLAAYPDLLTRSVQMSFRRDTEGLLTSVANAVNPLTVNAQDSIEPLLNARIVFAADGLLQSFTADGSWVNASRNRDLIDSLRTRKAKTDSDAVEALTTTSTTSPMDGAISPSQLDAQKWRRFLGDSMSAAPSRFVWRDGVEAKTPPARPAHVVEVSALSQARALVRFRCEFEPVGGRLVAVIRQ